METFELAIARRARALREERHWTQDALATRMRQRGVAWTRPVVAAFERGTKQLSFVEVVALTAVFGNALREHFGERSVWIAFGDVQIHRDAIARLLPDAGVLDGRLLRLTVESNQGGLGALFAELPSRRRAAIRKCGGLVYGNNRVLGKGPRTVPEVLAWLETEARGELERRMARKWGVDPRLVALAAFARWDGRSATGERERRAAERPRAKQHISRALIAELGRFAGWV